MSKIGRQPIPINDEIKIEIKSDLLIIKGPKGTVKFDIPKGIKVIKDKEEIRVERTSDNRKLQALYGTMRSLIANYVQGVSQGWEKVLELHGVGYRVKQEGEKLIFQVGYSHSVEYMAPSGVKVVAKGKKVHVTGIDKQLVGEVAARIKSIKKPDKYKGKGIRYEGEVIKLKPGKKAKTGEDT